MTAYWKGLLIILTFSLISCVDSNDAPIEENVENDFVDSTVSISDAQLFNVHDQIDSSSVAIDQDEDLNCEAHFKSAMNLPKPARLNIVHCEYWSSERPVWLEHSYRFELENDEAFFKELISHNGMVKFGDNSGIIQRQKDWFLPKEASNYVGFHAEDDFDDFEVFRDLKTGHIFIRGSQY